MTEGGEQSEGGVPDGLATPSIEPSIAPNEDVSQDGGAKEAVEDSSSSDSDSSSSSESVNEEVLRSKVDTQLLAKDTDEECFQNRKSRVLHRPGATPNVLLCGRRITANYVYLKDGASFKWARCSSRFRGEVLSNADQLVAAFDAVRAKRA